MIAPPEKLYKYYSVNMNSLAALINKYSWYSHPKAFNDPFDANLIYGDNLDKLGLFSLDGTHTGKFSDIRILSLTSNEKNLLMWSHYASSHTGFCIEFTDYTDEEIDEFRSMGGIDSKIKDDQLNIIRNAKEVEYLSTKKINDFTFKIPLIDKDFEKYVKSLGETGPMIISRKIMQTIFMKHTNWEEEKEFRLLICGKINKAILPGKITGVYFGMNMSNDDKETLKNILYPDGQNWIKKDILDPDGPNRIKCHQMYRPDGKYSLEHEELKPGALTNKQYWCAIAKSKATPTKPAQ